MRHRACRNLPDTRSPATTRRAALPPSLLWVAHANPFFYMIDGIRFAVPDHADGSVVIGVAMLAVVNVALWWWCFELFRRGYKLKA